MKMILGLFALVFVSSVNASIIDFEDLASTDGTYIPQGYNDFSWTGSSSTGSWVNSASSSLGGGTAVAHSGVNYAWSNGGASLTLTGPSFNVDSLWVSTLFGFNGPHTFNFEGYLNGALVESASFNANYNTWTLMTLNFTNIDELRFDTVNNTNVLVDDISFTRGQIPLPAPLVLIGIGLIGLAIARKQK